MVVKTKHQKIFKLSKVFTKEESSSSCIYWRLCIDFLCILAARLATKRHTSLTWPRHASTGKGIY